MTFAAAEGLSLHQATPVIPMRDLCCVRSVPRSSDPTIALKGESFEMPKRIVSGSDA